MAKPIAVRPVMGKAAADLVAVEDPMSAAPLTPWPAEDERPPPGAAYDARLRPDDSTAMDGKRVMPVTVHASPLPVPGADIVGRLRPAIAGTKSRQCYKPANPHQDRASRDHHHHAGSPRRSSVTKPTNGQWDFIPGQQSATVSVHKPLTIDRGGTLSRPPP